MSKLSRINQEKKKALDLLELVKSKLNARTYTSFVNKIDNFKRIDAVKRFSTKLNELQISTDKNISKSTLKQAVEKVIEKKNKASSKITNTLIKKKSKVVDGYNVKQTYERLLSMTGIVKLLVFSGNTLIKEQVIDLTNKKKSIYTSLIQYTYGGTDYPLLDDPDLRFVIVENQNISAQRIAQAYKRGITNCVLTPIIQYFQEQKDNAKTKSTMYNYSSRLNKAKRLEEQYREKGVKEKELQGICDELQINIQIDLPFQKKHHFIESNKKALRTFKMLNVRLNHVELNEVFNKDPIYITAEELQDMFKDYSSRENFYFTYTRALDHITSITTLTGEYKCKQEYNEFINNFEIQTNLINCKLDDFKDKNISQYVRQGCHFLSTIDYKPMTQELNDEDEEDIRYKYDNCNHMDMKNAYINYRMCKYYQGFLGKITDFRKTNKIVGLGYYTINEINLSNYVEALNKRLRIFRNNNVYPSPVLNWLTDNNCKYTIIEGCWGTDLDFSMDDDKWLDKELDVKYYCKYIGSMFHFNDKKSFYMKAEPDYIQNLISIIDYDTYNYFGDSNELRINYKKTYNSHLSHVCGFVLGYTLLNMLEQITTMKEEDIIRVCVDGIYYYGDYEMHNCFRKKDSKIGKNIAGNEFISCYYPEYEWECKGEHKDFYKKELHKGVGGGGKTTNQVKDDGLIKKLYLAPSWKLARNKEEESKQTTEFGAVLQVDVHYKLLVDDPEVYSKVMKYNTLIIDEVSMLDNRDKEKIFERFNFCKIIMCGDPDYQLDGFNTKGKYMPFQCDGFDYCQIYKTNYRVKCKRLSFLLNKIRELLAYNRGYDVKEYVKCNFQKGNVDSYKTKDMILVSKHLTKDTYTEKFKDLEKYIVKNNTKNYSNSEILFEKPKDKEVKYELRHAYTTHSIQGETAKYNLYINLEDMSSGKMIYTALSRARYWEQIILVD
jgi:hypothetical protein